MDRVSFDTNWGQCPPALRKKIKIGQEVLAKALRSLPDDTAEYEITVYDFYAPDRGYMISEISWTQRRQLGLAGVSLLYVPDAYGQLLSARDLVISAGLCPGERLDAMERFQTIWTSAQDVSAPTVTIEVLGGVATVSQAEGVNVVVIDHDPC